MKKISFQFVTILLVIGLSACGWQHHDKQVVTTTTATAPVLSFSPSSGAVGSLVTLSGTDFSAATSVSIGGVTAILVNKSTTDLTAMVMPGASNGQVSYTDSTGTTTISGTFNVSLTGVPATPQGLNKLVASGQTGAGAGPDGGGANTPAEQGYSIAVSADGNTAVVGGPTDQSDSGVPNFGAAWVYTRDSSGAWAQQAKLFDATAGSAQQGWSVAVSADGNTAVVGGPYDNNTVNNVAMTADGAAWVYTRSGTTWAMQQKLVASDASSYTNQGNSVAVSADGNTAVVGGDMDNGGNGAAWVWTRSGTTWTQQSKLFDASAPASIQQGWSVAVSADGSTVLVGGPYDYDSNYNLIGAAWVYTLSNGTWMPQGKLTDASDLSGNCAGMTGPCQGWSVALSADGNTAVVGGPSENSGTGAAWVYTRSGGTWTQPGSKLPTGTGTVGPAQQGISVAVSADGTTAVVGGNTDSSNVGAAWVYALSGGTWTQPPNNELSASDATVASNQGYSVALSADGSTAMVGGYKDSGNVGAAWPYIP